MSPTGAILIAAIVGLVVIVGGMFIVFHRSDDATSDEQVVTASPVTVASLKTSWWQTFGAPTVDVRLLLALVILALVALLHYYLLAIVTGVATWAFIDTYVTKSAAQRQIERLRDLQTFAATLVSTATSAGNLSLKSIIAAAIDSNPENRFVNDRRGLYRSILEATDPNDHQAYVERLIERADDAPSRTIDQVVILTAGSRIVSIAPLLNDLLEAITPQLTTFESAYRSYIVPNISVARVLLGFGILSTLGAGAYYAGIYTLHPLASLLMQASFSLLLLATIVVVGYSRRPFSLSTWFV